MIANAALIIAKRESKRLPDKNILDFCGKPMFLWNLEKCLLIFHSVFVSSEDSYILSLAEERGAIPIERPLKLCGDTPNIPVYQHAFDFMKNPRSIVAVQANSPTIKQSLIALVKTLMDKWRFDEVMTCHQDLSLYGSVWALSKERLFDYPDPYNSKPNVLLRDVSVDIHTQDDFDLAKKQLNERLY